jgi:hypothetical protein
MFKRVALLSSMTLFGAMLALQPATASAQDFGRGYHDRGYSYRGGDRDRDHDRGDRGRDWRRDEHREREWRGAERREWRDRDYRAYRPDYYGGSVYLYGGGAPAYGYGYGYSAPCR